MLAEIFRLFLRLFSRAKRECYEFPCGRSLPSVESAIKGAGGENTKKSGRFAMPSPEVRSIGSRSKAVA
jgi:hypothetical protein